MFYLYYGMSENDSWSVDEDVLMRFGRRGAFGNVGQPVSS